MHVLAALIPLFFFFTAVVWIVEVIIKVIVPIALFFAGAGAIYYAWKGACVLWPIARRRVREWRMRRLKRRKERKPRRFWG